MKTCSNFVISPSNYAGPVLSLPHPLNFLRHRYPLSQLQLTRAKGQGEACHPQACWQGFPQGAVKSEEIAMRGLSQLLLPALYSPPLPRVMLPITALQNNPLGAQPLVSQGGYVHPAGTAETLLAAKPAKSSQAATPLRNEGNSALQQLVSCIRGPLGAAPSGGVSADPPQTWDAHGCCRHVHRIQQLHQQLLVERFLH